MPSDTHPAAPVASSVPANNGAAVNNTGGHQAGGGSNPEPSSLPAVQLTQKERIEQLETQLGQMQNDLKTIGAGLNEWMKKMEEASESRTATQPASGYTTQGPPAGEGLLQTLNKIADAARAFGGQPTNSALEQQLISELTRGYTLWLRGSVRQMQRSFGAADHMIPSG